MAITTDAARASLPSARSTFLAIAAALTALRVAGLVLTPLDLHGDEAQYWLWSRSLEWGYFSKPPLIAWAIALTTGLFGDMEWAVRLAAPFAHAAGATALFFLGRRLYGDGAGLLAGVGWLTMPGVWLSSAVISTDALLLPLWSLALLALWRLREGAGFGWAAALGAAVGAGFLAKYAMSYFAIGAALLLLIDRDARHALFSLRGLLALGLALAILAPNLAWNAANDFATVAHTAANANLEQGVRLQPNELLQFLFDQLGVFGPFLFLALLAALWSAARRREALDARARFLLVFVLPPLVVIAVQAVISRAHANWAAAAYPAAMVFLAGALGELATRRRLVWIGLGVMLGFAALGAALDDVELVKSVSFALAAVGGLVLARGLGKAVWPASLAIHAVAGAAFIVFGLFPAAADQVGAADWFKRVRGWERTAAWVAAEARAAEAEAIAVDNRLLFNELSFYMRAHEAAPPLRMWVLGAAAHNHAEATAPLTPATQGRVLIVGMTPPFEDRIAADFARIGPLTRIEQPLGGGEVRRLSVRVGEGFAPVPRTPDLRSEADPS